MKVIIRHEGDNRKEYGYGVYVNGYIEDEYFGEDGSMGLWASECVPFGQNSEANLKAAEKRVRRKALRAYRKQYDL